MQMCCQEVQESRSPREAHSSTKLHLAEGAGGAVAEQAQESLCLRPHILEGWGVAVTGEGTEATAGRCQSQAWSQVTFRWLQAQGIPVWKLGRLAREHRAPWGPLRKSTSHRGHVAAADVPSSAKSLPGTVPASDAHSQLVVGRGAARLRPSLCAGCWLSGAGI